MQYLLTLWLLSNNTPSTSYCHLTFVLITLPSAYLSSALCPIILIHTFPIVQYRLTLWLLSNNNTSSTSYCHLAFVLILHSAFFTIMYITIFPVNSICPSGLPSNGSYTLHFSLAVWPIVHISLPSDHMAFFTTMYLPLPSHSFLIKV